MIDNDKYVGLSGETLIDFTLVPYTEKLLQGRDLRIALFDNALIRGSKGKRKVYIRLIKKIIHFIEELEQ